MIETGLNDVLAELVILDAQVNEMTKILEEKQEKIKTIMQENADLLLHGTKKATNKILLNGATVTVEVKAIDRKQYPPDVTMAIEREKRAYKDAIKDEEKHYKSMRRKIQVEAQNAGNFEVNRSFYCKVSYE